MLRYSEYLPYAPDKPGEQVKINHKGCPAGIDTKERLYIKRSEDGRTILAFCQHCRSGSRYNMDVVPLESLGVHGDGAKRSDFRDVELPSDDGAYDSKGIAWPIEASQWVWKYGITNDELLQYRIFYSDFDRRILIPNIASGRVNLYQLRAIYPHQSPKYLTRTCGETSCYWMASNNHSNSSVVLVEDALSAVVLGRFANTVALLSTSISDKDLIKVVDYYKKFVIWLDNDNTDVCKQAMELKVRLELFGESKILTKLRDPKHYGDKCGEIISRFI